MLRILLIFSCILNSLPLSYVIQNGHNARKWCSNLSSSELMCSLTKDCYINISKAFSSSLVERIGTSTILNSFVPIKQIAEAKGLKSTRSLWLEINKPESKYISRKVKVNRGTFYEILFSSLKPELQQKLRVAETIIAKQYSCSVGNLYNFLNRLEEVA